MKELTIPENISLEKELITGIRKQDVPKLLLLAAPGVIIGITVWICNQERPMTQLIAMLAAIGWLALSYAITARVEGSPSILSFIELLIRYHRQQQRYLYKQGEENIYVTKYPTE